MPHINRLYYDQQLRGQTTVRVDESVKVFNFDCLFRQHVSEWAIPRCAASARTAVLSLIAPREGGG